MYYYYDSGELQGPFSIHELRSKVNGDELVRNESNQWQAAQDIEGWDEVVQESVPIESEEPIETPATSTENLIESESTEMPEVGGIRIKSEERTNAKNPDDFDYSAPNLIGDYFHYGDEYITGGTLWVRMMLQGVLIYAFGLGIILQIISLYKRMRSLGFSGQSTNRFFWIFFLTPIGLVVCSGILGASNSSAASFFIAVLGMWYFGYLGLIWWLILTNSKDVMLGGPKALLRKLRVDSVEKRIELNTLLKREQDFRNAKQIPSNQAVVPILIPTSSKEEFQSEFGTEHYCLAVRDSKHYFILSEMSKVPDMSRLIKRTPEFEEQYEEFKALVAFKKGDA